MEGVEEDPGFGKEGGGLFSPTRWSLVRRAAVGGEDLGSWIGLYWFPLYAWARHKGWKVEDAADHVQEFLGILCRRRLLERVDPSRGRLRSWLLKSFTNHLASAHKRSNRQKRGGSAEHLSIDWQSAESAYLADHCHATDTDRVYARAWATTLMDEALEELAAYYRSSGRGDLFEVLLPALEASFPETTYAAVSENLDMSAAALRQAAVRFRHRYRRILLEVAAKRLGITCEEKLHAELRDLLSG